MNLNDIPTEIIYKYINLCIKMNILLREQNYSDTIPYRDERIEITNKYKELLKFRYNISELKKYLRNRKIEKLFLEWN